MGRAALAGSVGPILLDQGSLPGISIISSFGSIAERSRGPDMGLDTHQSSFPFM